MKFCIFPLSPCFVVFVVLIAAEFCIGQQDDFIRQLQFQAVETGEAAWGHWGDREARYSSWTNHSNRLVPIYTFGVTLDKYTGSNSSYRCPDLLTDFFGELPANTANPRAEYMDQTEVYFLMKDAIAAGKKHIVLFVFDGLDWHLTRAASIYNHKQVAYQKGYGQGLAFLDYDRCLKDAGDVVSSPHNTGTNVDVDAQTVSNIGGDKRGGYSADHGGYHSWSEPRSEIYLLGKLNSLNHVVSDSASSATSMNTGFKTYNSAINVTPDGKQLIPIARQLQENGFKVGVVTSVPISHATPAAAYANNVSRNDYQDISRDMLGLPSVSHRIALPGLDVVIGCGYGDKTDDDRDKQGMNFVPGNKYLTDEDLAKLDVENAGRYAVAQRTQGKKGADVLHQAARQAVKNGCRLLGFFGTDEGHLPYQTANGNFDPTRGVKSAERYAQADIDENPTLADMTKAALAVLGDHEQGFWLMIEPGDVDWASHNNNIDDSIGAVFSGEAAFEVVTRWVEKNSNWDETAVVVTADHGHFLVLENPAALTERDLIPVAEEPNSLK